jgi:competence protein ComEC
MIEPIPLFKSIKERVLLVSILILVVLVNLSLYYLEYRTFKSLPYYETTAKVVYAKERQGKAYAVVKLKNSMMTLYTTAFVKADFDRAIVYLTIDTRAVSFYDYLRGFYAYSKELHIIDRVGEDALRAFFSKQHRLEYPRELFGALFFAEPLSEGVRDRIASYGLSHLVAISGFHIGLLFGVVYFILRYALRGIYDRWLPYRNLTIDLSFLSTAVVFVYVYYLGFIPSVLRAFAMLVIGYLLYIRHIKILNYETLLMVVVLLIAFFPKLVFSLGFFFSVAGVFYIYLFLQYFGDLPKRWAALLLCVWVYVAMLPIVHYFFDPFSWYQLYSPLISLLFSIFYLIELVLHSIGYGGLLDPWIDRLLNHTFDIYSIQSSTHFFYIYVVLSLLGSRSVLFFKLYVLSAASFLFYIFLATI